MKNLNFSQHAIIYRTISIGGDSYQCENQIISSRNSSFIADMGYDALSIYNTSKNIYDEETFIPLNQSQICVNSIWDAKRGKFIQDGSRLLINKIMPEGQGIKDGEAIYLAFDILFRRC